MQNSNSLKIHEKWMNLALDQAAKAEALDEVPIGAVIVLKDELIASAYNDKESTQNALRHAELIAIERASQKLGRWRLNDCRLYVTLEPCPMCAGGLVQARIGELIFGASDPKGGGIVSVCRLFEDFSWNHRPQVLSGVLQEECSHKLSQFFKNKR